MARLLAARVVVVVAVASVVLAGWAGGLRYVYCAPMGTALLDTCCPHVPKDTPRIGFRCCEQRVVPTMADARAGDLVRHVVASPAPAAVPAPPIVLAAVTPRPRPAAPPAPPRVRPRAGADPPGRRVHAITSRWLI